MFKTSAGGRFARNRASARALLQRIVFFGIALLPFASGSLFAQQFPHPQHMAPQDFAVMPWDYAPSDPELLRGMKEAGLNIAGMCRAEDVDRVRAAGLSCFLADTPLNRYDWNHLPPDDQIRRDAAELARRFGDNPTVLGVFLTDEPKTSQLSGVGHVAALLREAMPGEKPYINLFPYREGQAEWYVNYEDYVRGLVNAAHPSFLSFDNYSLSGGEMGDEFFVNLEIVRKVALDAHIPFWSCAQAVAHFGYMEPSDATFRLQAYSTLAYGGRGFQYFTYFTPERGNYRLAAIDQFGNKTPTWNAMRYINYQIHALAPTLIRLHSTGVFHYPDVPKRGHPLSESRLVRWISMIKDEDQYVKPSVAARFLVGEFEDEAGRSYLMIVNKDLNYSFKFEIDFKQKVRSVMRINPYSGREEPAAGEQNWLAPGGGVLLRVE